jgi:hypothetical protein
MGSRRPPDTHKKNDAHTYLSIPVFWGGVFELHQPSKNKNKKKRTQQPTNPKYNSQLKRHHKKRNSIPNTTAPRA